MMDKTRFLILLLIVVLIACVFRSSGGWIEGFETPAPTAAAAADLKKLPVEEVLHFNRILEVYSELNDTQKVEFMNRIHEIARFIHSGGIAPSVPTPAPTTQRPYVPLTTQRPISTSAATTQRPTTQKPVQAPPATIQAPPATQKPVQASSATIQPIQASSITSIPFK